MNAKSFRRRSEANNLPSIWSAVMMQTLGIRAHNPACETCVGEDWAQGGDDQMQPQQRGVDRSLWKSFVLGSLIGCASALPGVQAANPCINVPAELVDETFSIDEIYEDSHTPSVPEFGGSVNIKWSASVIVPRYRPDYCLNDPEPDAQEVEWGVVGWTKEDLVVKRERTEQIRSQVTQKQKSITFNSPTITSAWWIDPTATMGTGWNRVNISPPKRGWTSISVAPAPPPPPKPPGPNPPGPNPPGPNPPGPNNGGGDGGVYYEVIPVAIGEPEDPLPPPIAPDHDDDCDGLTSDVELVIGTDPDMSDSDGDGMGDGWEVDNNFDAKNSNDAAGDYDQDGLTNLEEFQWKSNPLQSDGELLGFGDSGDGMSDLWEVRNGGDPSKDDASGKSLVKYNLSLLGWKVLSEQPLVDQDNDMIPNAVEKYFGYNSNGLDSDGDGISDFIEVVSRMNPLLPSPQRTVNGVQIKDFDSDGIEDIVELQRGLHPGRNDTDGDGFPDGWEDRYGLNPLSHAYQDLEVFVPFQTRISDNVTPCFTNNLQDVGLFGRVRISSSGIDLSDAYRCTIGSYAILPRAGGPSLIVPGKTIAFQIWPMNANSFRGEVFWSKGEFACYVIDGMLYWERVKDGVAVSGGGLPLVNNQWNRIALSFENDRVTMESNLVSSPVVAVFPQAHDQGTWPLVFGYPRSIPARSPMVSLAQFRVYNRLLSSQEINALKFIGDVDFDENAADVDNDGLDWRLEYNYRLDPIDPDTDNDGIKDGDEINGVKWTSPSSKDTDQDGISDDEEIQSGTDSTSRDSDGDGLDDGAELRLAELTGGRLSATSPLDGDSDDDGMPDGYEVKYRLNPMNATDAFDDADDDAASNLAEYTWGTNPRIGDPIIENDQGRKYIFGDDDADGVPNYLEGDGTGLDPEDPYSLGEISDYYREVGSVNLCL